MRLCPRVKSNAGSPDVERCKHVKSRATTVYFRLGRLRRVSTYVQQMWGIIGHVTVEAGNTVGTDGAPPQYCDIINPNIYRSQAELLFFLPDLFFIDKKSNCNFCNKQHNWYNNIQNLQISSSE